MAEMDQQETDRQETEDIDLDSSALRVIRRIVDDGGALLTQEGEPVAWILPPGRWVSDG